MRLVHTALGLPALVALLIGCGPPPAPLATPTDPRAGGPPIGMSAGSETGSIDGSVAEGAVELTLRRASGEFVEVGELRGQIVVLFVFATFDTPSQMTLRPLRHLTERSPEIHIVGIAAQQGARLLVDAYEHALTPPFVITYDPEETITAGTSALGELEAIPTVVVLDRRGVEAARHVGYCDDECISALVALAH